MNTIVVTGGLGFIGSNLIKILNKKNYYIINIDKINYSSNFQNISSNIKNYKFYKEDINKRAAINDIINKYNPKIIFNLAAWLDTGTIDGLHQASQFVEKIEKRQGLKIACLEEIALHNKWISKNQIMNQIKFYGDCDYSKYLKELISL
jgi:dTDP-D-glucose 4,6-dehydratase